MQGLSLGFGGYLKSLCMSIGTSSLVMNSLFDYDMHYKSIMIVINVNSLKHFTDRLVLAMYVTCILTNKALNLES